MVRSPLFLTQFPLGPVEISNSCSLRHVRFETAWQDSILILSEASANRRLFGFDGGISPVHGVWQKRVPTQALQAACAVLLLIVAKVMWRRTPFPGALFLLILLSYSSVRLLLELARERANRGRQFRVAYALSATSRELNRPIPVGWQGGDTNSGRAAAVEPASNLKWRYALRRRRVSRRK